MIYLAIFGTIYLFTGPAAFFYKLIEGEMLMKRNTNYWILFIFLLISPVVWPLFFIKKKSKNEIS